MNNIQLLLVAAGGSSRMKRSKQLLPWGNVTLIEHQIATLLTTGHPLTVVLGAYADQIKMKIAHFPIDSCINQQWEQGMGSSIAYGVAQLLKGNSGCDGVLISLIDQPLLTTDHFKKMFASFTPGKKQIIVSSSAKGWFGAPVLFDAFYVDELRMLKSDHGAKEVTKKHKNAVIYIAGGDELQDMDTEDAYLDLLQKSRQQF